MNVFAEKQSVRKQLRAWLAALAAEQLHDQSVKACALLSAAPEFQAASVVMMFLSLSNEVDTTDLVTQALARGKTVVVPSVVWAKRRMIPVVLDSLECEMSTDRYGLRTPVRSRPVAPEDIDLVVVPGLGFDEQGNRLGRGGGAFMTDSCAIPISMVLLAGWLWRDRLLPMFPPWTMMRRWICWLLTAGCGGSRSRTHACYDWKVRRS